MHLSGYHEQSSEWDASFSSPKVIKLPFIEMRWKVQLSPSSGDKGKMMKDTKTDQFKNLWGENVDVALISINFEVAARYHYNWLLLFRKINLSTRFPPSVCICSFAHEKSTMLKTDWCNTPRVLPTLGKPRKRAYFIFNETLYFDHLKEILGLLCVSWKL